MLRLASTPVHVFSFWCKTGAYTGRTLGVVRSDEFETGTSTYGTYAEIHLCCAISHTALWHFRFRFRCLFLHLTDEPHLKCPSVRCVAPAVGIGAAQSWRYMVHGVRHCAARGALVLRFSTACEERAPKEAEALLAAIILQFDSIPSCLQGHIPRSHIVVGVVAVRMMAWRSGREELQTLYA